MNQLESRLKEEKAAHLRGQERELDQFRHLCDRDVERLRTRIKLDLENRVCGGTSREVVVRATVYLV